ncbi:adrenocorticotropic hormone receptor-like [Actinia tenebrosa]|uniref:Adrenocorticotropic hormone receptor-like n=1 Tax=Actinia tenebrosa TaxID=6105 RepID=A0A6P8HXF0_ACTTE|nr:adrenocorticotropic hormone receptor-like [Actinia tenebrosa]
MAAISSLLIVYTISKTPSLRTPSNILILALAISDLGGSIFSQSLYCALSISTFKAIMNNSTFLAKSKTFCQPVRIYFRILSYDNHYYSYLHGLIVFNSIMAFVAGVNNVLVICTIARTPSLRKPANILILGLALSDLGSSLLAQPSYCFFLFADIQHDVHRFCQSGKVYAWSVWMFTPVSFATLISVTADRFLAVELHLRYQELVTTKRYGIVLILIWAIGLVISVSTIIFVFKTFPLVITGSVIIGTLICANSFFLFKISRVIRRHSLQIQAQQQSVQQSIDMPRYKKSVNTMYYVIGVFLFCYIPLIITMVVHSIFRKDTKVTRYMYTFSESLALANGVLNPVLYFWRIEELRKAAYNLLKKMWKCDTESV